MEVPSDAEERQYLYKEDYYGVTLYGEIEESDEEEDEVEKARREAREKENIRVKKVQELAERAYQLRYEFIKNFNPKGSHIAIIERMLWDMACFEGAGNVIQQIDKMCGTDIGSCDTYEEISSAAEDYFDNNPVKPMLTVAYLLSGDDGYSYIISWNGGWNECPTIDRLYHYLEKLGYQISDDEKKLMDGSHELFDK